MTKTALITGASSGIGLELAKIFASKGKNLVITARSISVLESLKSELEEQYNISVYTIEKDLSEIGAAKEIYDEIKNRKIQIDYLINNAGFGDYGFFHQADWDKLNRMITLNITSLTHLCHLYLDEMVERQSGKIMNVASTAAFQPGPLMAIYFASKSFVLHFTEAIANEVKDKSITITALCPGVTKSGFFKAASFENSKMVKGKKMPSAEEVALFGYKAMMKGKKVAIHGLKNYILANGVRFAPRSIVVNVVRKMEDEKK